MKSEIFFEHKIKESGYKLTNQRKLILDILIKNKDSHLSLEEIYTHAKTLCPEIGLATIYRTINLLDRINLVYKIFLEDGKIRYEINDNEGAHKYHHLICMKCESVDQMNTEFLNSIEQKILEMKGFLVKEHRIKLYGYCSKCKNS